MPTTSPDVVFRQGDITHKVPEPRSQASAVKNAPPATPRESTRFMSPHITGDYQHRIFSQEPVLEGTPALPRGDYAEPQRILSVKVSGYLACLRKLGFFVV